MRTSTAAIVLPLALGLIACATVCGSGAAVAGKRSDSAMEALKQEAERRREEEKEREAERRREEEREREAERRREEARRAAELQRQQSKKSSERQQKRSDPRDDDDDDDVKSLPEKNKSADNTGPREQERDDDTPQKGSGKTAPNPDKTRAEAKSPADEGPPRSLVEMFQRMKSAADPAPAGTAGNPSRAVDADNRERKRGADAAAGGNGSPAAPRQDAGSTPAKPAPVKTARPGAGSLHLLPPGSDFKRVEVLAVTPKGEAVAKAKALGFRAADQARLDGLGLSVTKLVAPDGMSAGEAKSLLASLELGTFSFNRKYRIYRASANAQPGASARPDNPLHVPMDTECGTDRCYGPSVIGWKPKHRSCAARARIGIIDTAIDRSHPAFRKSRLVVHSVGSGSDRRGEKSQQWHGTGILGLLAGSLESDTPGLVPDAQFLVADAFYADDDGAPASDTLRLLSALDWLERQKADLVNMSLAGPPDDLLKQAVDRLSEKGVIFVAAAGNDGPTAPPNYPAAYPNVIAVTAVGRDLKSYRHANRGPHIDIAAPGVQIWTALPGAGQGYHSGTSFAVPFVTAAIASILPPPGLRSKSELMRKLEFKDLGEPGRDPVYGNGLLVGPSQCGENAVADRSKPVLPWLVPGPPAPKSAGKTWSATVRPAFAP